MNFLTTNTNGIRTNTKLDELGLILRRYDVSIALLSETHLDGDVDDNRIQLKGYHVLRRDRNFTAVNKSKGGGVVMYLSETINYFQPSVQVPDELEVLWCILQPSHADSVIVGGIYLPPDSSASRKHLFIEHIIHTVDHLRSSRPRARVVLLGDFNSALDTDQLARQLNMQQIVTQPTRGAALLDKIMTDFEHPSRPQVLPALGTADHKIEWLPVENRIATKFVQLGH